MAEGDEMSVPLANRHPGEGPVPAHGSMMCVCVCASVSVFSMQHSQRRPREHPTTSDSQGRAAAPTGHPLAQDVLAFLLAKKKRARCRFHSSPSSLVLPAQCSALELPAQGTALEWRAPHT